MNTRIGKTNNASNKQEEGAHKKDTVQSVADHRTETLSQRKLKESVNDSAQVKQLAQLQEAANKQPAQKKSNKTGLPDGLKSGIESLSEYSMDDVNVSYNSSQPAQLNAHAYAQGSQIHVAPGQEKHLPHEAWHVVQQKQGRVKPTMQMKGKVNVNDDAGLEKEADVMGAKALQTKATEATLLDQDTGSGPVQRKVGLEIEVPSLHLFAGNMRREAPRTQAPRPDMRSRLLDSDSDEDEYGAIEHGTPYDASDRALVKGKAISTGAGWKLTADLIGGQGVVEFITDPVDETNDVNALGVIANAIRTVAQQLTGTMANFQYSQLAPHVVVRRMSGTVEGNIHITGGIKAAQIITLLQQLSTLDGTTNDLNVDAGSRGILAEATRAAQDPAGTIAAGGPEYQGLVALLAGYVAGQRRYGEMSAQAKQVIHDARYSAPAYGRIDYCAGAPDIEQFMRTGDITGSDVEIAHEYPVGGKAAFLLELRTVLREAIAPRAAKMMVPVLSRSSLAELKGKATMPGQQAFIADVMTAAGLPGGNAATALFPVGLDTPGHAGRTIEATPDITVAAWLQSIYAGQNLQFSDEVKSFEKVGPSDVPCFCGIFRTREKGAILEIRALDGEQLVPAARWGNLANTVSQAFAALNQ